MSKNVRQKVVVIPRNNKTTECLEGVINEILDNANGDGYMLTDMKVGDNEIFMVLTEVSSLLGQIAAATLEGGYFDGSRLEYGDDPDYKY